MLPDTGLQQTAGPDETSLYQSPAGRNEGQPNHGLHLHALQRLADIGFSAGKSQKTLFPLGSPLG